jgi:hypothetical protein
VLGKGGTPCQTMGIRYFRGHGVSQNPGGPFANPADPITFAAFKTVTARNRFCSLMVRLLPDLGLGFV